MLAPIPSCSTTSKYGRALLVGREQWRLSNGSSFWSEGDGVVSSSLCQSLAPVGEGLRMCNTGVIPLECTAYMTSCTVNVARAADTCLMFQCNCDVKR